MSIFERGMGVGYIKHKRYAALYETCLSDRGTIQMAGDIMQRHTARAHCFISTGAYRRGALTSVRKKTGRLTTRSSSARGEKKIMIYSSPCVCTFTLYKGTTIVIMQNVVREKNVNLIDLT
jgi:hypothetical protein